MAGSTLPATVIVMTLQTNPHHHILVADILLFVTAPEMPPGLVNLGIIGMASHAGLWLTDITAMVLACFWRIQYCQLWGFRSRTVVATHAFCPQALHMTIDALFIEPLFKLRMLTYPERIAGIVMQCIGIVAVPAGIAAKVGCRITGKIAA